MENFKCSYSKIEDLHKIVENPKNPNKHPERQIKMLAKIIDYQGQRAPIVVSNKSGFIVKGHCRLAAIKELGWTKAAVDYQDYESEAQEYADLIADNKIAELADHDDSMMIDELKGLEIDDFELLGLVDFELPTDPDEAKEEIEDDVPSEVDTRCKPGDLWILGDHRLLCGDATNIQHVEQLMGGDKVNIMATDPPYGVEYHAGWRANAKGVKPTDREVSSSIKNDDNADWSEAYCLFEGDIIYVWHASQFTDVVMNGLKDCGFEIKAQIIWNKNVHALSRSDYQWKHETCWYGVRKGAGHSWIGDRKQKTIWDIKNVMFERDGGGKTSHPTQKPIKIFEISILNHLKQGESIYDPFGGSGSTLIACEKTNRKCYMMELDAHYCDVILSRWEKYSDKKAVLSATG